MNDVWDKGVLVDRVFYVASLLLRASEAGHGLSLPKATGDVPKHSEGLSVSMVEMRLGLTFLKRMGYDIPEITDEGDTWTMEPTRPK